MVRRFATLAVLALALAGPARAQDGLSDKSIVLGQSAAMSGPAAQLGIQMRAGAKLWFDHVNAQGGINGRQIELLSIDPEVERRQVERVKTVRASRDASSWRAAMDAVSAAARSADNLVPPIIQAVEARATVGEIADAMRTVFGEHREIDG